MKTRIVLFAILAATILQACSRAMSPFEAANNPRGKKCRVIK